MSAQRIVGQIFFGATRNLARARIRFGALIVRKIVGQIFFGATRNHDAIHGFAGMIVGQIFFGATRNGRHPDVGYSRVIVGQIFFGATRNRIRRRRLKRLPL